MWKSHLYCIADCMLIQSLAYPRSEDSLKSFAVSASVHIHNAQIKSMVKPRYEGR